jgi:hypothetical protein
VLFGNPVYSQTTPSDKVKYLYPANKEKVFNETVDDFYQALRNLKYPVHLEYKDNKGNLHTEYVIGYFEKGYSGKAVINIKSADENGKLEVEIKSNTSLY